MGLHGGRRLETPSRGVAMQSLGIAVLFRAEPSPRQPSGGKKSRVLQHGLAQL